MLKDALKAFDDFKNNQKSLWRNVFWYVEVCIFWKFIQYTIHCDKAQISKKNLVPGPETQDPKIGTRDPRHGTQKVDFQQIFTVFFETWRWWINSFALCVYVYFLCFSLPYHKAYKLLIFYHLNELLFARFFPCSCYEIFKFLTKPVIILRSYIESSEKDLNWWK